MRPLKFISALIITPAISLALLSAHTYAAPLNGNDNANRGAISNVALVADPSLDGAIAPDTGTSSAASQRGTIDQNYCNHRKLFFGCSACPSPARATK